MPGARRARSLACKIKKHTSIVTTVTPGSPGIPRAMVLTVSFVLSPVTGLVCHRRQRSCLRELDASVGASGPHDFENVDFAYGFHAVMLGVLADHVRLNRRSRWRHALGACHHRRPLR
jgi:hypothetical protein